MTFLYPGFFILLFFPLGLFMYSLLVKKEKAASFFSPEVLKVISTGSEQRTPAFKYRLFLLLLILFVFALVRPVLETQVVVHQEKSIPLIIALDISKSMTKSDFYPSRLEFALSKIDSILNSPLKLRVGLLLFAQDAYEAHPLSEDKNSLQFIANNIEYTNIIQNSTNLFAALEGGATMLENYKNKNILILSDIETRQGFEEEKAFIKKEKLNILFLHISKNSNAIKATYSSDDINQILKLLESKSSNLRNEIQKKEHRELFYLPLLFALFIFMYLYFHDALLIKKITKIFVFAVFIQLSTPSEASLLDLYYLNAAQNAYINAEYKVAITYYQKTLQKDDTDFNAKVYYNIANAYVKLKQLYLAKKYYKKSLLLLFDKDAVENLEQIQQILANKKHKKAKEKEQKYKLPKRISVGKKEQSEGISSNYIVVLKNLVPEEEERLMQKLHNQKPLIFLRKLHTTRSSKNVLQD